MRWGGEGRGGQDGAGGGEGTAPLNGAHTCPDCEVELWFCRQSPQQKLVKDAWLSLCYFLYLHGNLQLSQSNKVNFEP